MALDFALLSNWTFEDIRHRYEARDTILYALGTGCGDSDDDLRFVYEKDLVALPSMATVLGDPGFWMSDPRLGADYGKTVHGEQTIALHGPLPVSGVVVARNAIDELVDKGPGRGLFIRGSRRLYDEADERLLAMLTWTIILRGDGGASGQVGRAPAPAAAPTARPETDAIEASPDEVVTIPMLRQAALIYRLSGDYNPLHADPAAAARAGFDRPILHGLCTMGVATRAILKACCANDPARLASIGVRFSAPVFPGETIVTEIWRSADGLRFRCRVPERNRIVVLDAGRATLT